MFRKHNRAPRLFEWLADHNTSLDDLKQCDPVLYTLIDDYIRLLDSMNDFEERSSGREIKHLLEMLRQNELVIIDLISKCKTGSSD